MGEEGPCVQLRDISSCKWALRCVEQEEDGGKRNEEKEWSWTLRSMREKGERQHHQLVTLMSLQIQGIDPGKGENPPWAPSTRK